MSLDLDLQGELLCNQYCAPHSPVESGGLHYAGSKVLAADAAVKMYLEYPDTLSLWPCRHWREVAAVVMTQC